MLITGESGCGKGVIAKLIHAHSRRAERSLVTVNIGSLQETVFESEMFGHVKGAFTDAKADRVGRFELADGGTLFLDEIANIPPAQQARLLRVLEDGQFERLGSSRTHQVDVRVLAATNANMQGEVDAGRFRADLLYRLNTIHIHLPPLRERGDDIVRLAQSFLKRHAHRYRREVGAFSRRRAVGAQALRLARQRARAEPRDRARRADVRRNVGRPDGSCARRPGSCAARRRSAARRRRSRRSSSTRSGRRSIVTAAT